MENNHDEFAQELAKIIMKHQQIDLDKVIIGLMSMAVYLCRESTQEDEKTRLYTEETLKYCLKFHSKFKMKKPNCS